MSYDVPGDLFMTLWLPAKGSLSMLSDLAYYLIDHMHMGH